MDVSAMLSGKFYENIQNALRIGAPPQQQEAAPTGHPSFAETTQKAAASFVDTLRQSEETAQAGMVGRADPQSVVTAIASAEIAVQSAVMVRDKVVESYQEILRMPV